MKEKMEAKDRLILALDPKTNKIKELLKTKTVEEVRRETEKEISSILDQVAGKVGFVKINYAGLLTFQIIKMIKDKHGKVWLDWKWKDIPSTVEGFVLGAIINKVDMVTIHADGGAEMIERAVKTLEIVKEMKDPVSTPKILAVSVLTSIDDDTLNYQLEIPGEVVDKVRTYALLAQTAGVDGIVASAQESPILRRELDPEMIIVTPGIKPEWAAKNIGQKRITTPYQAIKKGSTYLVVGSAIIKADEYGKTMSEAADAIVDEIQQATDEE